MIGLAQGLHTVKATIVFLLGRPSVFDELIPESSSEDDPLKWVLRWCAFNLENFTAGRHR